MKSMPQKPIVIILSCSATKRNKYIVEPQDHPANSSLKVSWYTTILLDYYDGPLWKTLRSILISMGLKMDAFGDKMSLNDWIKLHKEIISKSGFQEASLRPYESTWWETVGKRLDAHLRIGRRPLKIYAMSAKYGLVRINRKIEPYDVLLGRDITPKALTRKMKPQVKRLIPKDAEVYAFVSRKYSQVLEDTGLKFFYVKGGIGTKRKRLKELFKNKLSKKYLEKNNG